MVNLRGSIELREVSHSDESALMRIHRLLVETMNPGFVEEWRSFETTVSDVADSNVVPVLVEATVENRMAGCIVAMYLKQLNAGFMAYAGVKPEFRRTGIYAAMRETARNLLDRESVHGANSSNESDQNKRGIDMLISEQEPDGTLLHSYLNRSGGIVAPCEYEQPAVQGLEGRRLFLILVPLRSNPEGFPVPRIAKIVREIYRAIYRIENVEADPAFQRIISSLRAVESTKEPEE